MRRALAVVVASIVPVACAKVEVDGDASLCLTFDAGSPVASTSIPPALPCAVVTNAPDASVTPTDPQAELTYVCVAAEGGACPSPSDAHASLATCTESRSGDGCDHPLGGECVTVSTWSICGADPSASGACCYYVWLVGSTVYS